MRDAGHSRERSERDGLGARPRRRPVDPSPPPPPAAGGAAAPSAAGGACRPRHRRRRPPAAARPPDRRRRRPACRPADEPPPSGPVEDRPDHRRSSWPRSAVIGVGAFFLTRDDDDERRAGLTAADETLPDVTVARRSPSPTSRSRTSPIPDITIPDLTLPDITIPDITIPDFTIPDITLPDLRHRRLVPDAVRDDPAARPRSRPGSATTPALDDLAQRLLRRRHAGVRRPVRPQSERRLRLRGATATRAPAASRRARRSYCDGRRSRLRRLSRAGAPSRAGGRLEPRMGILDRILRAGEGKKLKALQGMVPDINALEPELQRLVRRAAAGQDRRVPPAPRQRRRPRRHRHRGVRRRPRGRHAGRSASATSTSS